jgi:hypothetical protein
MRRGKFSEMASDLIRQEDAFLRVLLAPEFYETMPAARVVERLADEIALHRDRPNPVGSFFFSNRMRREIALAPFGVLSEFVAHVPFLDDELYGLLSSLPAEFLIEQPLHDAVIRREFPEYADVPYARAQQGRPERPNAADLMDLGRYIAGSNGRVRKAAVMSRLLEALVKPSKRPTVETVAKWPVYLRQLSEL